MEQYTDDERVEDLKTWWAENGASIGIGIALGVIALFGWKYWGDYRNAQVEKASQAYDAFIEAVGKPDASQRGQAVLTDFPKSPYAVLAALRLAKLALDSGDTATAIQRLEWVIGNAKLDELKDIARLRLARVRLAASQPDEAQKLLDSVTTASLSAERDELKGDLHLFRNEAAKARSAYAAALAASGGNQTLQFKLDSLAAPTPGALLVPAPVPPPEPAQSESAKTALVPAGSTEPATAPVPAVKLAPAAEPVAPAAKPVVPAAEPVESIPAAEPVESIPAAEPVESIPAAEPAPVAEPAPIALPPSADPTPVPATDHDGAVPAPVSIPVTPGQ